MTKTRTAKLTVGLIYMLVMMAMMPFSASAAKEKFAIKYTKDSAGIEDGVVLRARDSVDTAGTSQNMLPYSRITVDYYNDGQEMTDIPIECNWGGITGFRVEDNGDILCEHDGFASKFVCEEGKFFLISYDSEKDVWRVGICYTKDSADITNGVVIGSAEKLTTF